MFTERAAQQSCQEVTSPQRDLWGPCTPSQNGSREFWGCPQRDSKVSAEAGDPGQPAWSRRRREKGKAGGPVPPAHCEAAAFKTAASRRRHRAARPGRSPHRHVSWSSPREPGRGGGGGGGAETLSPPAGAGATGRPHARESVQADATPPQGHSSCIVDLGVQCGWAPPRG